MLYELARKYLGQFMQTPSYPRENFPLKRKYKFKFLHCILKTHTAKICDKVIPVIVKQITENIIYLQPILLTG